LFPWCAPVAEPWCDPLADDGLTFMRLPSEPVRASQLLRLPLPPYGEALARYRRVHKALADHYQGFETGLDRTGLYRVLFAAAAPLLRHDAARSGELPADIAEMFAGFADYIAGGKLPGPIVEAIAGQGNDPIGPDEQLHQYAACRYIAARKAGIITDKHPTKTVAKAFSVAERTVQKWFKRFPVIEIESDTEIIEAQMRSAGKFYSQHGRSAQAIGARQTKRRTQKR
jgi:hypothetical protein